MLKNLLKLETIECISKNVFPTTLYMQTINIPALFIIRVPEKNYHIKTKETCKLKSPKVETK